MSVLKEGGIAVVPTDTTLGLVGSALRPRTVERVYRVRGRDRRKPLIVLIASVRELERFGIALTPRLAAFLRNVWPGPVSVVLPCLSVASRGGRPSPSKKFRYLHRGTGTIAFRVPKPVMFRRLLAATGPLVAPSANKAGEPPSRTIAEARRAFGDLVDAYAPGRPRGSRPSLVVQVLRY